MKNGANNLQERLIDLVRSGARGETLAAFLRTMHPADIAEALEELSDEERDAVVSLLEAEEAGEVITETSDEQKEEILEEIPVSRLALLVNEMPPDEAADVLEYMDPERADAVLGRIGGELARDVRELRRYKPETAGRIMTQEYMAVPATLSAGETLEWARKETGKAETVHHILVIDPGGRLLGAVEMQELLAAAAEKPVAQLMDRAIIRIHAEQDREIAAHMMEKYDLEILAVVGDGDRLLGIITVDDILEVISEEASEDMYRLAGIGTDDPFGESVLKRAYKRLPWLTTTLVGGLGLAVIIRHFQPTLDKILALIFFTPVIAGLSGNVGIQSSTITVRGLATGAIHLRDLFWLLRRELAVGAIIGLVCALCIALAAYGVLGEGAGAAGVHDLFRFCGILGTAVLAGILVAVLIGTIAPMGCHRLGIDPAVAAGPFVTVVIDIATQSLYLTIATLLLL
ncbi:MAG: magnesium transporter [Planctomycetota bacterium]